MGNNQSEINKKPYRWFEFKPYKIENNSNDPDQSYYNSLIINRGYIIPLSIDQCANLEKQLNLNNEGLSTKYHLAEYFHIHSRPYQLLQFYFHYIISNHFLMKSHFLIYNPFHTF